LELMRRRWQDENVSSFAYVKRGDITLYEIRLPKERRGQGIGTAKMRELLEFAQKHGMRVLLSPSTDFGASSKARLEKFYRGLGFEKNSGRNRDYRTRETMIWRPAGYVKSADPVTRDAAGRTIPLSQRFSTASDDTRYSLETSAAYYGESADASKRDIAT
jgi:GNAT superfamily N-acetyltransferase